MKFNNRLRKIGISTNPVDSNKLADSIKAAIYTSIQAVIWVVKWGFS